MLAQQLVVLPAPDDAPVGEINIVPTETAYRLRAMS
jgi:hypothetical protein